MQCIRLISSLSRSFYRYQRLVHRQLARELDRAGPPSNRIGFRVSRRRPLCSAGRCRHHKLARAHCILQSQRPYLGAELLAMCLPSGDQCSRLILAGHTRWCALFMDPLPCNKLKDEDRGRKPAITPKHLANFVITRADCPPQ